MYKSKENGSYIFPSLHNLQEIEHKIRLERAKLNWITQKPFTPHFSGLSGYLIRSSWFFVTIFSKVRIILLTAVSSKACA